MQWGKQIGSLAGGRSVCADVSGNIYIAGLFNGTMNFDPGPGSFTMASTFTSADPFVAKYDPSGNFIWAKGFGGQYLENVCSVVTDTANNVYVTGTFQDTIDFDPGPGTFTLNSPGYDLFILKLNSQGNFAWAKKTAVTTNTAALHARCMTLDPSGNIFVTGYFVRKVDFDPGPATYTLSSTSTTAHDAYVLKLDPSGNFVWAKNFGGLNVDLGQSITVDAVGNILILGQFGGTADFDPGPGTYTLSVSTLVASAFVLKLDPFGNFLWAKHLQGTGPDEPKSIITDATGNIYFAGGFRGTVDFDPGPGIYNISSVSTANFDIHVTKFDPGGNLVWVATAGTYSSEIVHQIVLDAAGDLCMTGLFNNGTDFDPGSGYFGLAVNQYSVSEGFIWKLDQAGNFIWAGNIQAKPYSINTDAVGNIYSAGEFTGMVDVNPSPFVTSLNAGNGACAFLLKFGNCTPITSSVTVQNVSCLGASNGSVSINASGGPPFTYVWAHLLAQALFLLQAYRLALIVARSPIAVLQFLNKQ